MQVPAAFCTVLSLFFAALFSENVQSTTYTSNPTWHKIVAVNTGPQFLGLGAHSLNIDDNKMYVFGGFHEPFSTENFTFFNNLWRFGLHSHRWVALSTGPSARAFHCATIDSDNDMLYVYGGGTFNSDFSELTFFNDFWKYDIDYDVWTQITQPTINPGTRVETQFVYISHHIYMFGGITDDEFTNANDLWKYTIATNHWTQLIGDGVAGSPSPRFTFYAVSYMNGGHNKFLVVNGEHIDEDFNTITLNDSFVYDVQVGSWSNVTPALPSQNLAQGLGLSSGASYDVVVDANAYIIYGGEAPGGEAGCGAPFTNNPQNTTYALDLDTLLWHQLFPTGVTSGSIPVGVKRNSGDTTDDAYYFFGGWSFSCVDNVGGQTWPPDVYKLTFSNA